MKTEAMIYTIVAFSALLPLGVIGAFVSSERRWRRRDREQAQRLRDLRANSDGEAGSLSSATDEVGQCVIPIQCRPFCEALWEDCPELAPSPRVRAIVRELAERQNERENEAMKLRHLAAAAALAAVGASTGCQSAMSASNQIPTNEVVRPEVTWPFDGHNFGAYCYNTIGCRVLYANHYHVRDGDDEVAPPPPTPGIQKYWNGGGYIGIDNFPPPAVITWRSLDGVAHEAHVDIGAIFKDQQVLHNVPAEKLAWNATRTGMDPDIILVLDDRAISVYMKAAVVLEEPATPGNRYSDTRDEPVLAWRHTY